MGSACRLYARYRLSFLAFQLRDSSVTFGDQFMKFRNADVPVRLGIKDSDEKICGVLINVNISKIVSRYNSQCKPHII